MVNNFAKISGSQLCHDKNQNFGNQLLFHHRGLFAIQVTNNTHMTVSEMLVSGSTMKQLVAKQHFGA
jgi:hypothetical protein